MGRGVQPQHKHEYTACALAWTSQQPTAVLNGNQTNNSTNTCTPHLVHGCLAGQQVLHLSRQITRARNASPRQVASVCGLAAGQQLVAQCGVHAVYVHCKSWGRNDGSRESIAVSRKGTVVGLPNQSTGKQPHNCWSGREQTAHQLQTWCTRIACSVCHCSCTCSCCPTAAPHRHTNTRKHPHDTLTRLLQSQGCRRCAPLTPSQL